MTTKKKSERAKRMVRKQGQSTSDVNKAIRDVSKMWVDHLHRLNCGVDPRSLSDDINNQRVVLISQLSVMAVNSIGADAKKVIPCPSCRSVAHSVAKLATRSELQELGMPQGDSFAWAKQRKAFLAASGFGTPKNKFKKSRVKNR